MAVFTDEETDSEVRTLAEGHTVAVPGESRVCVWVCTSRRVRSL